MQTYTFRLNPLVVIIVFLLAVIASLLLWTKPWQGKATNTITVTGEGTVTAVPDEFTFNPNYQKKADGVETATAQVSELGNGVVAKLKELGVPDTDLKTTVSSYPDYGLEPTSEKKQTGYVATYAIEAKVHDKEVAKLVLDYLATTPVLYNLTPASSFRKETRKQLEAEARVKAIQDAKTRAGEMARELGAKLGPVVTVSEVNQIGGPIYAVDKAVSSAPAQGSTIPPTLETGSQELTFSVSVSYRLR